MVPSTECNDWVQQMVQRCKGEALGAVWSQELPSVCNIPLGAVWTKALCAIGNKSFLSVYIYHSNSHKKNIGIAKTSSGSLGGSEVVLRQWNNKKTFASDATEAFSDHLPGLHGQVLHDLRKYKLYNLVKKKKTKHYHTWVTEQRCHW